MPGADRAPIEFSVVLNADDAQLEAAYLPVWRALIDVIESYPVVVPLEVDRFAPR
jgi:hypothetical protein